MRFRPCIDIHEGKVKQIVGGTLRDGCEPVTNYESELPPSHFAGMYRDDGLSGGHVIMLGKGNEAAAIEALRAFPGGLQAGGGIDPGNASGFLEAGASHVIVTSFVFRDGRIDQENLTIMKRSVGRERLVLDLSCKRRNGTYIVVTDRWQKETEVALTGELFDFLGDYCDEFLIHAAHVEGKRGGIDPELVELLAECTARPVTYAGGVRSLDDLDLIRARGKGSVDVTIGSALDLFGGDLKYGEVIRWFGAQ